MTNAINLSNFQQTSQNGIQPCSPQAYKASFQTFNKEGAEANPQEKNWAFIDIQNLYKGIKERGWDINWKSFRKNLCERHNVVKAVVFIGFVRRYQWLYKQLEQAGFVLEFREVIELANGKIEGGNVDADLASYVMDFKTEYSKAIIIADDGDYCRTIKSLNRQNKLKLIISSHLIANTSFLIKQAVQPNMLISIHGLRNQIAQTCINSTSKTF
jgi:NYN domain